MATLAKPTGPYFVGVADFELTDHGRPELLCQKKNCADRKLQLRMWYPAKNTTDRATRPYANESEVLGTMRGMAKLMSLPSGVFSHFTRVTTHSVEGADVIDKQQLPVVIFSHGLYSYMWQSTALLESIASEGYLVFSIHHPYDAAAVQFDSGELIEAYIPEQNQQQQDIQALRKMAYSEADMNNRFDFFMQYIERAFEVGDSKLTRSAPQWLADQLFVTEQLVDGELPAHVRIIASHGRYDKVAFTGMSFGGSTAVAACRLSKRCAVAINLDGADSHFLGLNSAPTVPTLHLAHDVHRLQQQGEAGGPVNTELLYNDFSEQRFAYAGREESYYQYIVKGSHHFAFSDAALLIPWPLGGILAGETEPGVMLDLQRSLVLSFLQAGLNSGDYSEFIDQTQMWPGLIAKHESKALLGWWHSLSGEKKKQISGRLEKLQLKLDTLH
ncbi:hypothetical protein [uncultured Pseudoteredinibacter sp.]|uniref:alpha/beta hydrolase n=1 Tax=uncultured Pseudoteredinibacter sp. TaxID=1641701 RepID=UPI0026157BD3|nr:hypothetical protein [uncultured Pseudoteredinibacter sp.]